MTLKLFVWTAIPVKSKSLISDLLTKLLSPHWPHLEAKCRCVVNRIVFSMYERHWTWIIFRSSCYQDILPNVCLTLTVWDAPNLVNYIADDNWNAILKCSVIKFIRQKNGKPADVSWLRHQLILLKGDFGSVLQFFVSEDGTERLKCPHGLNVNSFRVTKK